MRVHKGFTLIELMIVVAIIGIIAAIAYPSYLDSVMRTQRTDAMTTLSRLAAAQERYYTRQAPATFASDYRVLLNDTSISAGTKVIDSDEGYYTITLANNSCSQTINSSTVYTCFSLTAVPASGGPQTRDTDCWRFVHTEVGKSAFTKGGAANNSCW
ncbi:type IV pilin protein [Marinobacter sp.]|uniref:type IV pilin protein n=1 Tax=Marinobacter sp. TaxID=50741 RepID=UPI003A8E459E